MTHNPHTHNEYSTAKQVSIADNEMQCALMALDVNRVEKLLCYDVSTDPNSIDVLAETANADTCNSEKRGYLNSLLKLKLYHDTLYQRSRNTQLNRHKLFYYGEDLLARSLTATLRLLNVLQGHEEPESLYVLRHHYNIDKTLAGLYAEMVAHGKIPPLAQLAPHVLDDDTLDYDSADDNESTLQYTDTVIHNK